MAGTYIEGSSKPLSGVYSLIVAALSRVAVSSRGIVAYPFTANWGPTNVLNPVLNGGEFKDIYNPGTTLTAAKIYLHAYKGLPQQVLAYRMAASGALKGTCSLGATAPVLETLYPSDRAFTAIVKDGTSGGKVLEIVENGVKLFSCETTTVAELHAAILTSDYVRVKTVGTIMPVNAAGIAFTGGNNGSTVTATEYNAFLDVMEGDASANTFALDGVSDEAIIANASAWEQRVRQDGNYVTFVSGGPTAWDTDGGTLANVASVAFNYRGIVNVGNGCNGYTAAEMAIFVAARVASVALNRTLTDEVVPYATVNKKLKPGQRVTAKAKGTLVFVQDGDVILIDEGVNTLTTPPTGETIEFKKIRIYNAIDQITKDLEAFGVQYKKDLSNTDVARQIYAATVEETYLKGMANLEVIQEGYFYRPDEDYHGETAVFHPAIDEAFFFADVTPVDSMERIYQKIGVNF